MMLRDRRAGGALRLALALVLGSAIGWMGAPTAFSAEDVSRIRDKCAELHSSVLAAEYENSAEGKESRLTRVYKDFEYILKDSKTSAIREAAEASQDPAAKDRLNRLHAFLMEQRMRGQIAPVLDNTTDYLRTGSLKVPGFGNEVTLRNWMVLAAGEENRSNRRNAYLASRQLMENANVFLLNLQLDLNRASNELVKTTYPDFLLSSYGLDAETMTELARRVLQATEAEYQGLLQTVVATELDGMELKEVRAYDLPRIFRFASLDGSFPKGKSEETAQKWLRDLGMDPKGQRYLRVNLDAVPGKSPQAATFPIEVDRNVRVSVYPQGGLPDYWSLFEQMGRAEFHHHIDPSLSFEDRSLGSLVLPRTYGLLFQGVLRDPAWRAKYLKVKDEDTARLTQVLRFRQLYDLRRAAALHLFQIALHADPRVPPSAYAEQMETALGWSHTASEETDYLTGEDYWTSGVQLIGAALAEQLRQKLEADFGAEWFSDARTGKALKEQWAKGFRVKGTELAQSWGLDGFDPSLLCGSADLSPASTEESEAPAAAAPEGAEMTPPGEGEAAPGERETP